MYQEQKRENVFLSICIPSFNRGMRALESVQQLCTIDSEEIEIVVSNNGSTRNTEGYQTIKNMQDARIVYHEFEENQQFLGNFWQVLRMAGGRFAMMMSDEDTVIIENIPYFIDYLKMHPNIGVLRTNCQAPEVGYYNLPSVYASGGDEALQSGFLNNNYMSGVIYRTEMITEQFIQQFTEQNAHNEGYLYYPHLCLDMILNSKYDYHKSDVDGFVYGKPEQVDCLTASQRAANEKTMADYEPADCRIRQHQGYTQILNQITYDNILTKIKLFELNYMKLFDLILRNKNNPYQVETGEWEQVWQKELQAAVQDIDNLVLGQYQVPEVTDIIRESLTTAAEEYR